MALSIGREIAAVLHRIIALLVLAGVVASAGVTTLRGEIIVPVQGNPSCIAQCRAAHSQCRVATRGSPSCDGQLQGCLQGCLRRR